MMKIKSLIAAFLIAAQALLPAQVYAQPVGQLQNGQVWGNFSGAPGPAQPSAAREVLQANRTLFVGAVVGAPTISIATPAVVSLTAHGLSAGDAVVFQVPRNRTAATISAANPAIITMANTFVAGQPVVLASTGYLPTGITQGTTYYVIAAGLSGSQFEVSTTPGGAAVNTTAITATFTNGSATINTGATHNLSVGMIVRFAGTSVINFANATDYFVRSTPSGTSLTVALVNDAAAIVAGAVTTNGTLVQSGTHYVSTAGLLPTGITEGTPYFVTNNGALTANAFNVSDTLAHANAGTNTINTSGSVTGSPIYSVWTGNDANNGLAQTRAGALLTWPKAVSLFLSLDVNGFTITLKGANEAVYATTNVINLTTAWTGGGSLIFDLGGGRINGTGYAVSVSGFALPGSITVQNGTVQGGGGISHSGIGVVFLGSNMVFDTVTARHMQTTQLAADFEATFVPYTVIGGAADHLLGADGGRVLVPGASATMIGTPAFGSTGIDAFAVAERLGQVVGGGATYTGGHTGRRCNSILLGLIDSGTGAGAAYWPGNLACVGTLAPVGYINQ